MWTPATRKNYSRATTRYQSDVTDEEWRVIEPHLPCARDTGRPRAWPLREIINAIFYVMRSGCPWRQLPKDLPPWSTVYRWFATWRDACLFEKINHALVMTDRERVGREANPSAAIIDSQSVKTTEAGGPRGYDAGKKINGRKRHALVDTDGRGLVLEPHAASIQDRDGGGPLLQASRRIFPFIERVFADGGYAGERVATATRIIVEIVAKSADQVGFVILPRRWVVERFFAWICRNRRLAKDFEATVASARAFLYAASIMLLSRRIARAA
jgi:transposase